MATISMATMERDLTTKCHIKTTATTAQIRQIHHL